MSRSRRWLGYALGCLGLGVGAVVMVVVGCGALGYFALEYATWKNCWFPPRDPDIEVVVSACENPRLYSVSPDGRYVLYGTHMGTDPQFWLLDTTSGEVRPDPGCDEWWLTNTLRLGVGTPEEPPYGPYGWSFSVCDMSDGSITPLRWVEGLPGTTFRREDGSLAFSPEVVAWFQNAEVVYYLSVHKFAIALAPDFKAHPEDNYVLATPRASRGGDREAILKFLEENEIPYIEIPFWENPLKRSHDGRFALEWRSGLVIVDEAGTELARYEWGKGWLFGGQLTSSYWAYDNSGVYFQLERTGRGSLFLFEPPGPIQPILELKVPGEYLSPAEREAQRQLSARWARRRRWQYLRMVSRPVLVVVVIVILYWWWRL
ncbi:MAG: hypothetical protein D6791_12650 [Chloroflexi bacterium]|nr:MAG: hypothetical protein D6791_12650 [Chloroflexota bacterium]